MASRIYLDYFSFHGIKYHSIQLSIAHERKGTQYYAYVIEGPPKPKGMTEEDEGVVFRLREWVKSSEAKEAGKKGFRMRLIFDLLLFSIMAIIAITIERV